MKAGARYMAKRDDLELEDLREGRLFRPEDWPADYTPTLGTNDDMGQRRRFGYVRADGMWMIMPSPGTHVEFGWSEYFLSQRPPAKCGDDFCRARGCQSYCETAAPVFSQQQLAEKRPWWRIWQ